MFPFRINPFLRFPNILKMSNNASPALAPTMHEIAERAGVGKATVSLALRDDPRLRPETRRRIQRVAATMGYRTNATVANLMAQLRASRTPHYQAALCLLNVSADPTGLAASRTSRDWLAGCQDRASQLGYRLDHIWLHEPGLTPAALASSLESRNIRGLIISPLANRASFPDCFELIWREFACVVVGLRPAWPPLNFSSNDQFSTVFRAVRRLWENGYRRMGLVLAPEVDAAVDRRYSAGFWAGQEAMDGCHRLPMFQETRDHTAFRDWYTKNRPEIILSMHTEVKAWLETMGLDIPSQVALAHLDRNDDLPEWSGMQQNHAMTGAAAIDMLVGQLHRNETGLPGSPNASFVQSTWVEAQTTVRSKAPSSRENALV